NRHPDGPIEPIATFIDDEKPVQPPPVNCGVLTTSRSHVLRSVRHRQRAPVALECRRVGPWPSRLRTSRSPTTLTSSSSTAATPTAPTAETPMERTAETPTAPTAET